MKKCTFFENNLNLQMPKPKHQNYPVCKQARRITGMQLETMPINLLIDVICLTLSKETKEIVLY